MESFKIENLTFRYPNSSRKVLSNINLQINRGEFITLCGASGCGKSTLLRHFKTALQPHGSCEGRVLYNDKELSDIDLYQQASNIGFVMQSPDNQIVTDKVWHELAFGLESLGLDNGVIRLRVAEMASFLGIHHWFYKNVDQLSGGQKQLLNLGSILAMHPSILVLDEPTSQLDPVAAVEFLSNIRKVNLELGITVIITEHRLEEVLPYSDRVIVMDNGQIICDDSPSEVGTYLKRNQHSMFYAMPAPMRIYAAIDNDLKCPITVREGRQWIDDFSKEHTIRNVPKKHQQESFDTVLELKDVWFRYEKESEDIVKGLTMKVKKGELLTILGGNGTGKTTTLSLISGINTPYRGSVKLYGKDIHQYDKRHLFSKELGVLPQSPQSLFIKKTLKEDLMDILSNQRISTNDKLSKVDLVAQICQLNPLLNRHPYDLSGGEQQRAALAKILLLEPQILLMDEPTKGLDAEFKIIFADIIRSLLANGVTLLMVSHDIEFCAKYAHRCAMFFDGRIISSDRPEKFFAKNNFYTTSANRMVRHILSDAITDEDVISACGGDVNRIYERSQTFSDNVDLYAKLKKCENTITKSDSISKLNNQESPLPHIIDKDQVNVQERKLSRRTIATAIIVCVLIPLTILFGVYYLGDRKYYFISMVIILETMLPFMMIFESKKPQARELIIIAVLCAIGVAGRSAFFMLPQFKPVVAIVIISGVAFGGETGFLVGAITGFVSNMFFGQGPWTPWQMFAFGIIGFIAGILFKKGILRRNRLALSIFGGVSTFFIYGGIMNPASIIIFQSQPTKEMFYLAYLRGIPFDIIHAVATVVFLMILSKPLLEKLDRVKMKYGFKNGDF